MKSLQSSTNEKVHSLFPQASCWVIVDEGVADAEAQCLGLAEALGLVPTIKKVKARVPYTWIPKCLWFSALSAVTCTNATLDRGSPKMVIALGPVSSTLALYFKKEYKSFIVSLGRPVWGTKTFDAVLALPTETLRGPNTISLRGNMHRITPSSLLESKRRYSRDFDDMPKPRVMVCLDGTHPRYGLPTNTLMNLVSDLKSLHQKWGCSFFIHTLKHGEPFELLLQEELKDVPYIFIDADRDHSYLGQLAHTDLFIASPDAVNFISEAVTCGKPLFIYDIPGHDAGIHNFVMGQEEKGNCLPFDIEAVASSFRKRNLKFKPSFEPHEIAEKVWAVYKEKSE